jgi:Zn-dependent peptidase ImmA (M78 family)
VEFVAYRKLSGLSKKEEKRVENLVATTLEERLRLQEKIGRGGEIDLPVRSIPMKSLEDAERAAEALRERWNLGLDPIASMVDVLEDHSIHVLEIEAGEKFDGISAVLHDTDRKLRGAGAVTRRNVPGERQRLNLAHELGHLVLKVPEGIDEEKAAFRFAGAFLAPAEIVRREVGVRRAYIGPEELLLLKGRFGMSMQALLYRMRDLGIITESHYREWAVEINRRGWRRQEPGAIDPERPQWLRRNVLRALSEGVLAHEDAERMLGETLERKGSATLDQRRSFMKLSLDDRRRLLAEQAERMASHYDSTRQQKKTGGREGGSR